MSESLLDEAVRASRQLLDVLPPSADTRRLTRRASILARAAAIVELEPTSRHEIIKLVRLALDLREEVMVLHHLQRVTSGAVAEMMD
ncbi:MAG: hypothetical protein KF819_30285 [Labilithrix sp.]|nr:hypothetical protein [Labilithrix sp.]